MYQALYRKYRSQNFSQLVGQEVVAKTLKQAVEQEKISHAYLFSGPRGTGKTSVAKIFAKAMNCPNQVGGEPCNNCYICQAVTDGSLEDVLKWMRPLIMGLMKSVKFVINLPMRLVLPVIRSIS